MTQGNDVETAILMRAEDEASADIDAVKNSVDDANQSIDSMGGGAIKAGLAAFGLQLSLQSLASTSKLLNENQANLNNTIAILAPSMQEAVDGVDTTGLARRFATTENEIKSIMANIIANAGDVELSAEELEIAVGQAFGLMSLSGASAAEAAAAVGQAIQGNETDMQALGDASGRTRITMDDLTTAAEEFEDSISPINRLWAAVEQTFHDIVGMVNDLFGRDFGRGILTLIFGPQYKENFDKIGEFFSDTFGDLASDAGKMFVDNIWEPINEFFTQTLPDMAGDAVGDLGDLFPDLFGGVRDFFGIGGGGDSSSSDSTPTAQPTASGNISVVINGDVDTPERAAQIARDVQQQLSQNGRRGVAI